MPENIPFTDESKQNPLSAPKPSIQILSGDSKKGLLSSSKNEAKLGRPLHQFIVVENVSASALVVGDSKSCPTKLAAWEESAAPHMAISIRDVDGAGEGKDAIKSTQLTTPRGYQKAFAEELCEKMLSLCSKDYNGRAKDSFAQSYLAAIKNPYLNDVFVAFVIASNLNNLFEAVQLLYYDYFLEQEDIFLYEFLLENGGIYASVLLGVAVASFLIKQNTCYSQEQNQAFFDKLKLATSTAIGNASSWSSYGGHVLPRVILKWLAYPVVALGLFAGWVDNNRLFGDKPLDISGSSVLTSVLKTANIALFQSLQFGTYLKFGTILPVAFSMAFDHNSAEVDIKRGKETAEYIQLIGLFSAFAVMMARHPMLYQPIRDFAEQASNFLYAVGRCSFEAYALTSIFELAWYSYWGQEFDAYPEFFYPFTMLLIVTTFAIRFPQVPNLPGHSNEKLEQKASLPLLPSRVDAVGFFCCRRNRLELGSLTTLQNPLVSSRTDAEDRAFEIERTQPPKERPSREVGPSKRSPASCGERQKNSLSIEMAAEKEGATPKVRSWFSFLTCGCFDKEELPHKTQSIVGP